MLSGLIGGVIITFWLWFFIPKKRGPYSFDVATDENTCQYEHVWFKVGITTPEEVTKGIAPKDSLVCSECGLIQGTKKIVRQND